ncbi:hypothetical protein NQ315_015991 [Exocentrus adspersus]|uniref:Uncharacterized protein n=1 Tax=Exocentrus adspersus TaxID=1586481 RepID=A0AAV8VL42_9CUCU|nr:hypothetical protein NQ315_015991 [Exocentrus adspersus]
METPPRLWCATRNVAWTGSPLRCALELNEITNKDNILIYEERKKFTILCRLLKEVSKISCRDAGIGNDAIFLIFC